MFCVTCSSMIWYVSNKASPTQQYQTQNWLKVFHNQKRWQLNCNQVERRCTNWKQNDKDSNTTYTTHTFNVPFPGLPRWAGTRKWNQSGFYWSKKQETVSGSGINWTVCKYAPCSRQKTTPALHHSVFLQAGCPSCSQTNSIKALKALNATYTTCKKSTN